MRTKDTARSKMVVTVLLFIGCLIASLVFQNWLVSVVLFFCSFACAEYLGVRILLKQQWLNRLSVEHAGFSIMRIISRRFDVLRRTYRRSIDLSTTLPLVLALLIRNVLSSRLASNTLAEFQYQLNAVNNITQMIDGARNTQLHLRHARSADTGNSSKPNKRKLHLRRCRQPQCFASRLELQLPTVQSPGRGQRNLIWL